MSAALALTLLLAPVAVGLPMPTAPRDDDYPPGRQWADVLAAPLESDLHRFPPRSVCSRARIANRAFVRNLEFERELWPASQQWKFTAAVGDANAAYAAWDKLDDLHGFQCTPWWRKRLMLAELRTLIGADAYAAGEMPAAVPGRWFRDLK